MKSCFTQFIRLRKRRGIGKFIAIQANFLGTPVNLLKIRNIYITISTFTSVCPYGVCRWRPSASRPTSDFYYVQSSRSPVRPLLSKTKPSCVYSILKPHGQSSKREVRPLLSEAKPSCIVVLGVMKYLGLICYH